MVRHIIAHIWTATLINILLSGMLLKVPAMLHRILHRLEALKNLEFVVLKANCQCGWYLSKPSVPSSAGGCICLISRIHASWCRNISVYVWCCRCVLYLRSNPSSMSQVVAASSIEWESLLCQITAVSLKWTIPSIWLYKTKTIISLQKSLLCPRSCNYVHFAIASPSWTGALPTHRHSHCTGCLYNLAWQLC